MTKKALDVPPSSLHRGRITKGKSARLQESRRAPSTLEHRASHSSNAMGGCVGSEGIGLKRPDRGDVVHDAPYPHEQAVLRRAV